MYDASGLLGSGARLIEPANGENMAKLLPSPAWPSDRARLPISIEHTVQVSAQTLYEAVAQALRIFRDQSWCDHDLRQSAASVLVKIAPPQIEHRVKISEFEAWLASPGKSPVEAVLKSRLRDIVEG